jgi:hypothetical protein
MEKTPGEKRATIYGLERMAMCDTWEVGDPATEAEIETSKAISLKRIADRLDDLASGCAALNVDVRQV